MSDFLELIKKRQSCRNFSDVIVDKELLINCIEAARIAPSACNSQPWSFIVVNENKEVVKSVARCTQSMGMNKFTNDVPAFIIVCEENANMTANIGNLIKKQQYAQGDVGIAVATICYAATDLGLSTCVLGWFDEKKLKEKLKLPNKKKIRLVIAMGYAKNKVLRDKKRKSIEKIMTYM